MLSDDERRTIHDACERLSLDYSYHADHGESDAWAALFAEDAEMELFGQTHVGRAAIQAGVQNGAAPQRTVHAISNVRIDVISATEAAGHVYISVYVAPKGESVSTLPLLTPFAVGEYQDRYRKTAEGWRFARRAFVPLIMAG